MSRGPKAGRQRRFGVPGGNLTGKGVLVLQIRKSGVSTNFQNARRPAAPPASPVPTSPSLSHPSSSSSSSPTSTDPLVSAYICNLLSTSPPLALLSSMSASPQPAQVPPLARSPQIVPATSTVAPSLSHTTTLSSDSPAQLASLLSSSLHEAESLKHELEKTRRRAEKAERLLQTSHKSSPTGTSAPGTGESGTEVTVDANRLAELESRVGRLEVEKDELEARLVCLQDNWTECERYLIEVETSAANARASFSQIMSLRGGVLTVKNGSSGYSRQPLTVRTAVSSRTSMPLSAQHPSTMALAPTSTHNSRIRPRSGSLDGSYGLTGPGGPPPSKRARNDRDHDPQMAQGRHYSQSVSSFLRPRGYSNSNTAIG